MVWIVDIDDDDGEGDDDDVDDDHNDADDGKYQDEKSFSFQNNITRIKKWHFSQQKLNLQPQIKKGTNKTKPIKD